MSRTPVIEPVRIPADVDRDDRVLANLTARQLAILAVTGVCLYGAWTATRALVPPWLFAAAAVPVAVAVAVIALGSRDGVGLDRLLVAGIRQRLAPRRLITTGDDSAAAAPEWLTEHIPAQSTARTGELHLPAEDVSDTGVIDLGRDGLAVAAVVSTVNFALRTPAEQEALVATFARFLHGLTAPAQILVRADRLDLSGQISDLHENAGALPHPALENAAREHAEFLHEMSGQADLLRRQVLLVLREPLHDPSTAATGGRGVRGRDPESSGWQAAEVRLTRRLTEAIQLLSPAGLTVTALDTGQATAVMAAACNPDRLVPPAAGLAGADEIITVATDPDDYEEGAQS
ncbi:PrgI family protein [Phytoactinopolyspora endophytica]|uniref:PrgI family protein n=1 Tax=Phytoactinopolyspora endophytica TaxID=1642495 RepID=UPI0013EA21B5|nr:PrgI family protein [Phytoactinopolyspora endophytica]